MFFFLWLNFFKQYKDFRELEQWLCTLECALKSRIWIPSWAGRTACTYNSRNNSTRAVGDRQLGGPIQPPSLGEMISFKFSERLSWVIEKDILLWLPLISAPSWMCAKPHTQKFSKIFSRVSEQRTQSRNARPSTANGISVHAITDPGNGKYYLHL